MDVKKLGRIPDGGGHRTLGRQAGKKNRSGVGHSFLHSAIDDHSRLVYSEILTNETKETAAGSWQRANAFYASHGITVLRVMSDNGGLLPIPVLQRHPRRHQAQIHPALPAADQRQDRALPPHPRRRVGLRPALQLRPGSSQHLPGLDIHSYNHHRPHTGFGGKSPIDRVHNVSRNNN